MNTTNESVELAMALLSRVHAGTATLPGAETKWASLIQDAFDAQRKIERARCAYIAREECLAVGCTGPEAEGVVRRTRDVIAERIRG